MIVKVQLSLSCSEKAQQVQVYNKSRSVLFEGPASQSLIEKMDGRSKAFFHATIVATKIELDEEAPWQMW